MIDPESMSEGGGPPPEGSTKGQVLVAAPHLVDPNFVRTVVLILEHSADGSFGLILNREANRTLTDVWQSVGETPCPSERNLNIGGPVDGPLLALHTNADLAELTVMPGLHFSTQSDHLDVLVHGELPFRIYSGYAGWGAGQLEGELANSDWIVAPARLEYVFSDPDGLWKRVLSDIAARTVFPALNVKRPPPDPLVN